MSKLSSDRPSLSLRHPRPRPRHGRLLVECLVALTLVVSAAMLLLSVREVTVGLSDRARQFDLAEQGAWRGAARALQAPCATPPVDDEWLPSARHRSRAVITDGAVRRATITDTWQAVGVGTHAVRTHTATVGVRCD